jgi:hypothetical protein
MVTARREHAGSFHCGTSEYDYGHRTKAAVRTSENGMSEVYVQLSPGESWFLKTFNKEIEAPLYKYIRVIGQQTEITGTWTIRFLEGGPELPASITGAQLGSWTNYDGEAVKKFSGTASYNITFKKPESDADGWMLNLGQVCESAQVLLNGKDLGTFIGSGFHVRIPRDIMQDENKLEIMVTNLMLNRIIDLDKRGVNWKKFYNTNFPSRIRQTRGFNGQFDASKLSPVDSGLIGPVTLEPIEFLKF